MAELCREALDLPEFTTAGQSSPSDLPALNRDFGVLPCAVFFDF
jgi:hypothetical protein